jgi:hypothetical protein
MTYQPFLIAAYATGLDREVQPWLLPNDAYFELFDGYVYRGVTNKRDGYSGFANGLRSTYCESRMVKKVTAAAMTGAIDGVNKTYTITATPPVRRGTFVVNGSNPVQVLTDNGTGTFTGDGTGTINYTTGAVSITFTSAPVALSTVTATYDYHPGLPVMGVMNYWPNDNIRQMLVADTREVNIYNPATDRLDFIASASAYTGTSQDFWSWVNYPDAASAPRLLFCNGAVGTVIQNYNGSTVTDYAPTFNTGTPPVPTTLNARQIFEVRDRLVLFQTIEGGVLFPRRIRISGTGLNTDVFDNTATGAGLIDIPDNTFFFGAAFNRDDILFFTEAATWMLKYSGNDVTPFTLEKIDGSRGSKAAFSVIAYLNRTFAASPRGLILSNGYEVERYDENIPFFALENINNQYFQSCFSGFVDEDRDVYMLYPSYGDVRPLLVPPQSSDRILNMNFEEDNLAIYRLPLSCMGNFVQAQEVQWQDLTAANGFPNWDALAERYGSWLAFPSKYTPCAIGGGHKGEIWQLNDVENEDNPQMIRNITIIDESTVEVTTDWNNYEVGDYIVFEAVGGTTEINDKQGSVISTPTPFTTFRVKFPFKGITNAYTSGGIAARVIPFEALSKKLNPFADSDKKLRVGWMYFYVSVVGTDLTDGKGVPVPAVLEIDVITNDSAQNSSPVQADTIPFTYKVNCSNIGQVGSKQWVKIWINQTARFLQFRLRNTQAGAKVQIHAIMPGMYPTGRLV